MALSIASLNSGSNGNCYYIGNESEAILVDAGISCRETEIRMKRLKLSVSKIKAIFITHEHSDHIKGIETLSRKYELPVYITEKTFSASKLRLKKQLVVSFEKYKPISVGNLVITAFPKFHDADNPHSFIVTCNKVKVGIFTDIGFACKDVIKYFRQCNAAFLESNYDEQMLMQGSYPAHLKSRIRDGKGHLSNVQALELFKNHRHGFMSHLLLSHLSQNNNSPELVHDLFSKHAGSTEIIIASRNKETPVYNITNVLQTTDEKKQMYKYKPVQLSLF